MTWPIKAHRFSLPDTSPGQVKVPVRQEDLSIFFFCVIYKQIEELQNFGSQASGNFEKSGALPICCLVMQKHFVIMWKMCYSPNNFVYKEISLTHWGRVTHICVGKLTIIGSDNGLSPGRREAIIWTNDGILLIGPLGTNFSEILIEILTLSFKKMSLKVSSAKRRPFCLSLNVLSNMTLPE